MRNKTLKCKSKAYYNLTWTLKLLLLLPFLIYYYCEIILDDFSNFYFEFLSLILFCVVVFWVSILFVFDCYVDKKRKNIYDKVVNGSMNCMDGEKILINLEHFPMSRLSFLHLLSTISLVEIRQLNFEKTKMSLKRLKDINKYYGGGSYFDIFCDCYLLLIDIYQNEYTDLSIREFLEKHGNEKIKNVNLVSLIDAIRFFANREYSSFVNRIFDQNNNNNHFLDALIEKYRN